MMVKRAHAQDTFASGRFEIGDLNDHRKRFRDEDPAHDEEQQHLAAENRHAAEECTQR